MSKEHAYAYEAGYRDGSINYELEHCPACKNVADLQEALAENDRLRERITTQKQTIQSYRDESRDWREVAERAQADNAKLREENQSIGLAAYELGRKSMAGENAKLRELCVDMYRCSDPCNDCPHYNGSSSDFYCRLGIGWKARRMRELGIEVDG